MASEESKTTTSSWHRIIKENSSWLEPFATCVLIFLTCFYYVFDVFYVVPQLLGFYGQAANFMVSTWIVYNIFGNLWACSRKTSAVDTLPPELLTPTNGEEHLWHYCDKCQKLMPPRSWHCTLCKCCILKREHHCNFTGNCIGHNNQRYFIWLLFYLSLEAGLVLGYNFIFSIKYGFNMDDWLLINNPFIRASAKESHLWFAYLARTIFYINVLFLVITLFLFVWQIRLVWSNAVSGKPGDRTYDLGFGRNFAQVLGHRGLWTLLSPTIKSSLPHEGVQWQSKHTV